MFKQLTHWSHWLAFGLGSGLAPKAPGTFGTIAALPLWWLLLADLSPVFYLVFLLVTFAFGVFLCDRTSNDLGVHDHPGIVWDEWVGVWIALFMVPTGWPWVLAAFALFRFFDILKPWPIKWLDQKVEGGFGIMIDDVLAGLFALGVLQLAYLLMNYSEVP